MLLKLVKHFMDAGKPINSICHGKQILSTTSVLNVMEIFIYKFQSLICTKETSLPFTINNRFFTLSNQPMVSCFDFLLLDLKGEEMYCISCCEIECGVGWWNMVRTGPNWSLLYGWKSCNRSSLASSPSVRFSVHVIAWYSCMFLVTLHGFFITYIIYTLKSVCLWDSSAHSPPVFIKNTKIIR